MYWRELADCDASLLRKIRQTISFPWGWHETQWFKKEKIECLNISISPYLRRSGIFQFTHKNLFYSFRTETAADNSSLKQNGFLNYMAKQHQEIFPRYFAWCYYQKLFIQQIHKNFMQSICMESQIHTNI